ncbi:hypothetical protein Q4543_23585 [Salipiger sp. 1_MG-2023]|uniref:hypothetical protein n=1 Tax=Salipiger sp. 1_MG-2023 TaxID=3062665 RepID=UPI0026E38AF2|nr:hypothetical protein [Salipiger sp. 1_MG-2023]MDO6588468.1 hypothetical protein [Salipiger sp. 1_MG-2023]
MSARSGKKHVALAGAALFGFVVLLELYGDYRVQNDQAAVDRQVDEMVRKSCAGTNFNECV